MGFSRQEYWSGLPFPSPGDLPDPGIEPRSPALQADALPSEPPGKPKSVIYNQQIQLSGGSCWSYMFPFGARAEYIPLVHLHCGKANVSRRGKLVWRYRECVSRSSVSVSPHPEWLWNHVGGSHQHQKILTEDNLEEQEISECVICSRSHTRVCVHIYMCVCVVVSTCVYLHSYVCINV